MIPYGPSVILGKRELQAALRALPGRVVYKIMRVWVKKQADRMRDVAKRNAPRDNRSNRNKPETARLWRAIRSSYVKNLKGFPNTITRAIVYGAGRNSVRSTLRRNAARAAKGNSRRKVSAPRYTVAAPRARHFHLVVDGTRYRRQYSTGRWTGVMPRNDFFSRAAASVTASASGEVGRDLRDAYDKGIQMEIKRLERKYL